MSDRRQGFWRARPGRWWHFLVAALLVLLSLPVFAALALAIRLWVGPIDVTHSARRLLSGNGGAHVTAARIRLAWNGWREGPRAPLGLQLDDVRWGQSRIGHGSAALDFVALLHGRISVLALQADDAAISLQRNRAGGFGPPSSQGGLAGGAGRPDRLDFGHLQEVGVSHSTVALKDAGSGLSCHAAIDNLLLDPLRRPAATGVAGHFAASVSCGGPGVSLHGSGREAPDGDIVWRIASGTVVPAALARATPQLAALGGLDLPVTLTMQTALSGGFGRIMLPRALNLTATLGAGVIHMATAGNAGENGFPVRSGSIHLSVDLPDAPRRATRAVLSDATLVLAGPKAPTVHLAGTASFAGSTIHAALDSRIAQLDFARLRRYWPASLAPGGRRWVSGNITAGSGRNLVASAALESGTGFGGLHLTSLSGGVDAIGLTLFWLRPIAPLRGMDAHLVLEGPNSLRIESRHAVQEVPGHKPIAVGPTTMRITGLSEKDQIGRIDTRLRGAFQDVLALLAHPRLRLLSRHPLPFADPSGVVDAHLDVSLPLADAVKIDDVAIRVDAALTGVHLGNVAAGRDLDGANLAVSAGNDGLKLQGNGVVAGLPAALTYSMDFRPGGPRQSIESAHVSAPLDEAAVHREGLDGARRFSGEALAALDYDLRRDGAGRIALHLDLTPAGLDLPGWRKPAGDPAQASGTLGLQDGRLVAIEALHADGPGLLLDGHADVEQGHPRALVLDRFTLGRSSGSGRIELPAAGGQRPIHVALHGAVLDLAPFLASSGAQSGRAQPGLAPPGPAPSAAGPKDTKWRADLAFRRVLTGASHGFSMVTLHAEASGMRVASARLAIGGPTPATAVVSPEAGGRRLVLNAQDTGALLSALGISERIEGGVLDLEGRMEDRPAGMNLVAVARLGPFTVHVSPHAARMARGLSIYGFVTGAASTQLVVTRAEIPFTLKGGMLRLTDAHASNSALGATLRGTVDLRQDTLDLRGTVVPSYLLNAIPGKLPGLGHVFSPEKGGGLLAVTLNITGPIDKPAVRANPLALLAPGILRRLLFN